MTTIIRAPMKAPTVHIVEDDGGQWADVVCELPFNKVTFSIDQAQNLTKALLLNNIKRDGMS